MYIKGFAIYVALFAVACACAIIAVLGYKFWRSRRQRIYLAELEKEVDRESSSDAESLRRLKSIIKRVKTQPDRDDIVWSYVKRLTIDRHDLLNQLRGDFENKFKDKEYNHFEIAALDIFVEKAQAHLSRQGKFYMCAGAGLSFSAALILGAAIWLIHVWFVKPDDAIGGPAATVILFHNATLGALFLATVYLFVALARAFFHESTILFNRIHAARFGRLYVYLKYNRAPAGTIAGLDKVDIDQLDKAFGWNIEMHTGFKDVSAEKMTVSTMGKTFELLDKIVDKVPKIKTEGRD